MQAFTARAVFVGEIPEHETFCIVMAEHPDGDGTRLEFQDALSYDERDRELGMDTYCLCNDSGATTYGGVTGWQLGPDSLELCVNAETREAFGIGDDGILIVGFDPRHRDGLEKGLLRLLGPAGERDQVDPPVGAG